MKSSATFTTINQKAMKHKKVLDACCGSRMMWFNKNNPAALFMDKRKETHVLCDGRSLIVAPDVVADFTKMPFPDESFYHVVWDPPHLKKLGESSWMAKKYGVLSYHWRDDIRDRFNECMRVLKPNGTLVFKWNEIQVKLNDVLSIIPQQPLYGHTSGKHGRTIWLCFMKLNPESNG